MSRFLVRTIGGPHPGDRVAADKEWPLPERLEDEGGHYMKVRESQLTEDAPNILRGAEYAWVADS